MSNLGMGVMLHILSGGTEHSASEYYGQRIVAAEMTTHNAKWHGAVDCLRLTLSSGKTIDIWDEGQSCCENRFMTTDDDVQSLVGHELRRIEGKDGPTVEEDYETKETVFVEIGTDAGFITIVNHNEHNGYYGGFALTITEGKA